MRFPFISRAHHEEVKELLLKQLEQERKEKLVAIDRLGQFGLGGPLFTIPAERHLEQEVSDEPEEAPRTMIDVMMRSNKPSLVSRAQSIVKEREFRERYQPKAQQVAAVFDEIAAQVKS